MPRRKSSLKSKRAGDKKHLRNLKVKRDLKKALKKFRELVVAKNIAQAKDFLGKVFSQLDKAAKKGIIHRNTANRKKSRLARITRAKTA